VQEHEAFYLSDELWDELKKAECLSRGLKWPAQAWTALWR